MVDEGVTTIDEDESAKEIWDNLKADSSRVESSEVSEKKSPSVHLAYYQGGQRFEEGRSLLKYLMCECATNYDAAEHDKAMIYELMKKNVRIAGGMAQASYVICENNQEIFVDAVWEKSKVMLFLSAEAKDFRLAMESQYDCYCFTENFDMDDFLQRVKEE